MARVFYTGSGFFDGLPLESNHMAIIWKPWGQRTFEDKLLLKYWKKVGGLIYTEVFVGTGGIRRWGRGAKLRRIDAVRIIQSPNHPLPSEIVHFRKSKIQELQALVTGGVVEVIEIKRNLIVLYLDRLLLEQTCLNWTTRRYELSRSPSVSLVIRFWNGYAGDGVSKCGYYKQKNRSIN